MTLPVWAGTFAVFALLMMADLALTRKAIGLRAAAASSVRSGSASRRSP